MIVGILKILLCGFLAYYIGFVLICLSMQSSIEKKCSISELNRVESNVQNN